MDGFDHYGYNSGSSHVLASENWSAGSTLNCFSGRTGYALTFIMFNYYLMSREFTASNSVYIGFAHKRNTSGGSSNDGAYTIRVLSPDGTIQCTMRFNSLGRVQILRYPTTVLATGINVIAKNAWHYIEIYLKIGNSDGEAIVKVDGIEEINATALDTQNHASETTVAWLRLGANYLSTDVRFDDLYLDDTEFHGDCRIETIYPNADGTTTNFIPSTGVTHYDLLDENPPNNDTDYTESKTVTALELLGFSAIDTGLGSVINVALHVNVKKDDTGSRGVKLRAKSSATTSDSTEKTLDTDYIGFAHTWAVDPNTSVEWTQAGLNAAEFGVLITT
jgi:hypothetical protein